MSNERKRRQQRNPYKNHEGYADPTAYQAIKNLDEEERLKRLLNSIKDLCEDEDFEMVNRIVLRDLHTGKVWR